MLPFVSVLIIPERSDVQETEAKVNHNISEKQIYTLVSPLDLPYYQLLIFAQLINELTVGI